MDVVEAIKLVKEGRYVRRSSWSFEPTRHVRFSFNRLSLQTGWETAIAEKIGARLGSITEDWKPNLEDLQANDWAELVPKRPTDPKITVLPKQFGRKVEISLPKMPNESKSPATKQVRLPPTPKMKGAIVVE